MISRCSARILWVGFLAAIALAVCFFIAAPVYAQEPIHDDVPTVYLEGTLPVDKNNVMMKYTLCYESDAFSGYCKIKCQGSSSLGYSKKNFTVKTYSDADCTQNKDFSFLNWGPQNKFCLKANWIDFTHSRNVVSARLWGDMIQTRSNFDSLPEELKTAPNYGAVDGFLIKLYVNGSYYGRYTLNIPKDAWMANLDENNEAHCIINSESSIGSGLYRESALMDGTDWSDELHSSVPEGILTRWNEVISFISDASDEDFIANIDSYIDLQSLIDYDVFCVMICGLDSFGKNQLFFTYDGQKFYMSVYDLDSTFGLQWDGSELYPADFRRGDFMDAGRNLLFIRLENLFGQQIAERYQEVSQTVLSVSAISKAFDDFISSCPAELMEADKIFTDVNGNKIPSLLADTNSLEFIQSFVADRKAYNDQYFEKLSRGTLFSYDTTDSFGSLLVRLNEPYCSDGSEIVDTKWAPYKDDSDWTLVMKFRDDIVPDGPFSSLMTGWNGQNSDSLKLQMKIITEEDHAKNTILMGTGCGFSFTEDQFFSWVGGQPSTDGYHYLILSKHGDYYDIFYDGSTMFNYGAGIGDQRSDETVKLFATDVGDGSLLEKVAGTIEEFRVYDAPFTQAQCHKLYKALKSA